MKILENILCGCLAILSIPLWYLMIILFMPLIGFVALIFPLFLAILLFLFLVDNLILGKDDK